MRRATGREMDGGPIVPEDQVVRLPAMAVDEARRGHMLEESAEQRPALLLSNADDAGGEAFADEQRRTPAAEMDAHDRVDDRRDLGRCRLVELRAMGIA